MAASRVLLPTVDALCDAFYHVKDTPEAQIFQHCVRANGCCKGKTTCLIAQLVDGMMTEHFLRIYYNESQNSCAEGFLMRDERLLDCVDRLHAAGEASSLNIFLTQQPCHYSSSNDANSCTDRLTSWYSEWMRPRGVARLRIAAAYPYRSHWDERHMSEDDLAGLGRRKWGRGHGGGKGGKGGGGGKGRGGGKGGKGGKGDAQSERQEAIERARRLLANAREGTRRLTTASAEGVSLEAFSEEDWAFVLGVCEPSIEAAYAAAAPPFTPDVKARRALLDAFTKQTFDVHRPPAPPAPPPPPAMPPPNPTTEGEAAEQTGCQPCEPDDPVPVG